MVGIINRYDHYPIGNIDDTNYKKKYPELDWCVKCKKYKTPKCEANVDENDLGGLCFEEKN